MIDTPLPSSLWYRVAELKTQLVARARLHRHRYRGERWYLLRDPASGRVHRFTPAAPTLLAAMDGTRTVQQVWEIARARLGEDAPTQDEVIQLLGQLHASDLLVMVGDGINDLCAMQKANLAILTEEQPGDKPGELYQTGHHVVENVREVVEIVKRLVND